MQEKLIKFIDFVFEQIGGKFGSESSFRDQSYYYEKKFKTKITQDEIQYLEEKFFYDLFDPIGNVGLFKLSTLAQDIIDNYGSYSNYLKNQNQEISNYKEIKELERKNLELDIENKEYQKTIRDQESKIRKLDLRLKRFEFIQKWWWLIGIILIAIGWILSFL